MSSRYPKNSFIFNEHIGIGRQIQPLQRELPPFNIKTIKTTIIPPFIQEVDVLPPLPPLERADAPFPKRQKTRRPKTIAIFDLPRLPLLQSKDKIKENKKSIKKEEIQIKKEIKTIKKSKTFTSKTEDINESIIERKINIKNMKKENKSLEKHIKEDKKRLKKERTNIFVEIDRLFVPKGHSIKERRKSKKDLKELRKQVIARQSTLESISENEVSILIEAEEELDRRIDAMIFLK